MFVISGSNLLKNAIYGNSKELPPLNIGGLKDVSSDIKQLYDANERDLRIISDVDEENAAVTLAVIQLRHSAVERLRRCGMAYLMDRMNKLNHFYSDIGSSAMNAGQMVGECNPLDSAWVNARSKALAEYQRTIGLDLSANLMPPSRSLRTTVRCKVDFGPLATSDGQVAVLARDAIVELPSGDADRLLRLGILERLSH